jgi:periplasmic divalent cation tolerance protein
MVDARFIYVPMPDMATGERIARDVVGEGLAACVNLLPGMRSIYRWKGNVETGDEVVAVFKTTADTAPRLALRIKALHPYETPVIATLAVEAGNEGFLAWLSGEVPQIGTKTG